MHPLDPLTLFGLFAVTAMLVTYALEKRSRSFILAFSGACVLGSIYGFLQGAWPFGLVEAIWAVVALQRWRRAASAEVTSPAIACDITSIATAERPRYNELVNRLRLAVRNRSELPDGYAFQLRPDRITLLELGEWMNLERRCCPFLIFQLELKGADGASLLTLRGPAGSKEVLDKAFPAKLN